MAKLLGCYGIPEQNIAVDMGLGRGVHYHTGMVFEIHTSLTETDSQLCGGGRYDDLLRVLGSNQDTPAAGFAYGLERITEALDRRGKRRSIMPERVTNVLVVPISQQEIGYAIEVAQHLRRRLNLSVELDVKISKSLGKTLRYASKRSIPYVVILGDEERNQRAITVRKMLEREQASLSLNELVHSAIFSGRPDAQE